MCTYQRHPKLRPVSRWLCVCERSQPTPHPAVSALKKDNSFFFFLHVKIKTNYFKPKTVVYVAGHKGPIRRRTSGGDVAFGGRETHDAAQAVLRLAQLALGDREKSFWRCPIVSVSANLRLQPPRMGVLIVASNREVVRR